MPLYKTTPEDIINKSIFVFRTNGYYRTTMNDLAQATGLTKGAFYHHFTNKEDVMKKSLEANSLWFENKIFSIAYDDTLRWQMCFLLPSQNIKAVVFLPIRFWKQHTLKILF
jgi:AcrR family transcriptional regulator